MAPLDQAVLFGLALGGLVAPFQSFRISYKHSHFACCNITEGILYDKDKVAVPIQDKKCKQYRNPKNGRPCTTGAYSNPGTSPGKQEWTLLKAETLEYWACKNSPWCADITFSKCYKIIVGALSPWYFPPQHQGQNVLLQEFPLGMAVSVSGKICQRGGRKPPTMTFLHSPLNRFAKLKIEAVETLGSEECEGDKWKHHGLEAAPECDDFWFWRQVLITEGIKAPNWQALIADAQASSPEGMGWGTTMSAEAPDDTLWNARRDTVLGIDSTLASWS